MLPITMGRVVGSVSAGRTPLADALLSVMILVKEESENVDTGSSVNVVFYLAGGEYPIDFNGMLVGKGSVAHSKIMIRVSLADLDLACSSTDVLLERAAEAVDLAREHAMRKKMDVEFHEPALNVLGRVRDRVSDRG